MNKSMRSPKPVFFRKDGGWKSVSTDAIVCMEANASKCKTQVLTANLASTLQQLNACVYNNFLRISKCKL